MAYLCFVTGTVVRNVPCLELLTNGDAKSRMLREVPLRCLRRVKSRFIVGLEDGTVAVYDKKWACRSEMTDTSR